MTDDHDASDALKAEVLDAVENQLTLNIVGGNSKVFIGREPTGTTLTVGAHRGIVGYEPTELVVTARGGTLLSELENTLTASGQMLAFEPPHFSPDATIGGTLAAGLSGPRRPYAGSARDFVLGVSVLNGKGECLSFGGQVMKNVAGYDLSRLMVGAMGTLGVLLEVSLKVLPLPAEERTLSFEMDGPSAVSRMNELAATPLPISAAGYVGHQLSIRISGTEMGVKAAGRKLGGEEVDGKKWWRAIREQTHPAFSGDGTLWRLSVPSATEHDHIMSPGVIDWGGGLRWVCSSREPTRIREQTGALGGHAWAFRTTDRQSDVFHPLTHPLVSLHRRLKEAFDPQGLFNRGRMYANF